MNHSRITIGVAAVLFAAAAGAAEVTYGVDVGIGTSDNIHRVQTGEESETMLAAGAELGVLREDGRLHADINVDLSYVHYQDESYDGEVVGMANADLRYLFVPGRFEWVLTDSFGQGEIDPFAASTPDNRENINYFTTGPDFTVRLGSAGSLTLFGRYSATQFEEQNFDDERLLGGLSFGRELSARSELSLNATLESIEFDDPLFGTDYDRRSAFLRYDVEGTRTTLGLEAGLTQIDDGVTTDDSPLFALDISRNLSERSVLTFGAGVRSSDTASALRAGNIGGGGSPGGPDHTSTANPFETRHASLGWQFTTPRTGIDLSVGYEDNAYEDASLPDRERLYFQASASRQITPRVTLRGTGSLYSTDFDTASQDYEEMQIGLYLSWNVTGRFFVDLEVENLSRDGSSQLNDFDEMRAFLRLAWRNTGGASGAR